VSDAKRKSLGMIEEEHSNESQFDNPFDYYEHKSGSMDKMDTTKPEK